MTWTDDVWARNAFRALKETLDADGALKRDMIQFLLDEGFWDNATLRNWDSAVARFNACLNPNKSEFFKIGELWALMKRFGRHQLFLAMADDLGYDVRRRPTEERRIELLERIARALERSETEVSGSLAELERLTTGTAESKANPLPGGKAHFSLAENQPATAIQRVGCP